MNINKLMHRYSQVHGDDMTPFNAGFLLVIGRETFERADALSNADGSPRVSTNDVFLDVTGFPFSNAARGLPAQADVKSRIRQAHGNAEIDVGSDVVTAFGAEYWYYDLDQTHVHGRHFFYGPMCTWAIASLKKLSELALIGFVMRRFLVGTTGGSFDRAHSQGGLWTAAKKALQSSGVDGDPCLKLSASSIKYWERVVAAILQVVVTDKKTDWHRLMFHFAHSPENIPSSEWLEKFEDDEDFFELGNISAIVKAIRTLLWNPIMGLIRGKALKNMLPGEMSDDELTDDDDGIDFDEKDHSRQNAQTLSIMVYMRSCCISLFCPGCMSWNHSYMKREFVLTHDTTRSAGADVRSIFPIPKDPNDKGYIESFFSLALKEVISSIDNPVVTGTFGEGFDVAERMRKQKSCVLSSKSGTSESSSDGAGVDKETKMRSNVSCNDQETAPKLHGTSVAPLTVDSHLVRDTKTDEKLECLADALQTTSISTQSVLVQATVTTRSAEVNARVRVKDKSTMTEKSDNEKKAEKILSGALDPDESSNLGRSWAKLSDHAIKTLRGGAHYAILCTDGGEATAASWSNNLPRAARLYEQFLEFQTSCRALGKLDKGLLIDVYAAYVYCVLWDDELSSKDTVKAQKAVEKFDELLASECHPVKHIVWSQLHLARYEYDQAEKRLNACIRLANSLCKFRVLKYPCTDQPIRVFTHAGLHDELDLLERSLKCRNIPCETCRAPNCTSPQMFFDVNFQGYHKLYCTEKPKCAIVYHADCLVGPGGVLFSIGAFELKDIRGPRDYPCPTSGCEGAVARVELYNADTILKIAIDRPARPVNISVMKRDFTDCLNDMGCDSKETALKPVKSHLSNKSATSVSRPNEGSHLVASDEKSPFGEMSNGQNVNASADAHRSSTPALQVSKSHAVTNTGASARTQPLDSGSDSGLSTVSLLTGVGRGGDSVSGVVQDPDNRILPPLYDAEGRPISRLTGKPKIPVKLRKTARAAAAACGDPVSSALPPAASTYEQDCKEDVLLG